MDKNIDFIAGTFCGIGILVFILNFFNFTPKEVEKKMRKEAISHGAAYYEVDTNGVVTFKWNK